MNVSVFHRNLVDTARSNGMFTVLCEAWAIVDLTEVLKGSGPYTVFAPTDAAFRKLPSGVMQFWARPENKIKLIGILRYHISPGRISAADLAVQSELRTLNGALATIRHDREGTSVEGAYLTQTDIESGNGIIHVIDQVMLPKG
jgi:uncharacterized surface protein with fasciclin (FAS1) repeats